MYGSQEFLSTLFFLFPPHQKLCYMVCLDTVHIMLFDLTTVDHTIYMLLLHSLSHILSQSASANTVRLAVLKDKQKFSNITGSVTTAAKTLTDKTEPMTLTNCEEEKETLQLSNPSSDQSQKMDISQHEGSSAEIGSQVASLKMSDSGINMPSASGGNSSDSGPSAQFTLAMLSSALQNVNQSLGIAPGDDKQLKETATTTIPQSDTDGCVDVPGEKRLRLDTHEVMTLQQDTLPQDIHDKLHSNIR